MKREDKLYYLSGLNMLVGGLAVIFLNEGRLLITVAILLSVSVINYKVSKSSWVMRNG